MKKLLTLTGFVAGLVLAAPTWALTINGSTDVGDADTFLASADLGNSGAATEKAWVDSILGGDNTLTYYDESSAVNIWTVTDQDAATYALQFGSGAEPEYYFLKLGTGNTGYDTHYLFNNLASLNFAVVDFAALAESSNWDGSYFNLGRVSHIGGYGGTTSVPEPSTIALMGLGLLGMGAAARRRNKA